jgi:phage gp29-like protein
MTLPAGRIFAIVQKSGSYGEILEALYASFGNLDLTAFEEVLRQAMFAADLWGYMRAKKERP